MRSCATGGSKREPKASTPAELGARVEEAQLPVGERERQAHLVVGAQAVLVSLAPDLRAHAGQELVSVHGAEDIVVRADLETLRDPLHVRFLADHEDGNGVGVELAHLIKDDRIAAVPVAIRVPSPGVRDVPLVTFLLPVDGEVRR